MDPRFQRQAILAEIGEAGQQRLAEAKLSLPPEADEISLEYLRRAGVGQLRQSETAKSPPFPHADRFSDPEARRLGAASWFALVQLNQLLE